MNDVGTALDEGAIAARTRAWLKDTFLYMQANASLRDTDPLLAGGVIDSVGVIELVEFLHETFGIDIADNEITERNLGTLEAIGHFVHRKCQPANATALRPQHVA